MANKPWFQANIHAPGTGFVLLVIAICMVAQTIPITTCMAAPNKWGKTLLRNPPHWAHRSAQQDLGAAPAEKVVATNQRR